MKTHLTVILMMIVLIALPISVVYPEEPVVPDVDHTFSMERERRIDQLERLSSRNVINAFVSPEFFDQEDYLDKAIFRAFDHRSHEAIGLALGYVQSTQVGEEGESARKLYIAKRMFQIFPEEVVDDLINIYSRSGPKVRSNVIYVVGQMAGTDEIKTLLVNALSDMDYCQDVTDETLGKPLRVCDMAYNQLVIRYNVENVLRTIGSTHALDVRDYYIALLRRQL